MNPNYLERIKMEISQGGYPYYGCTNYYIASANMEILNGEWADRLGGAPENKKYPRKYLGICK